MANLGGANSAGLPRPPTMLEQLLEEINFQRTKEMRQLLKDDSGFVMLQGTTYWTDLFVRHFLFQAEHTIDGDDLLFFVRKKHVKTSSRYVPKFETEVDVFRKDSKKLPIGDPDIDWEETVYLNLVVHQFDYTLTLAICTRTSPKELQVLRRHSQKVYASPSRRRMDAKGDLEEMTYPHICFMVDNFDEVFCDILVRDGEMVCVELVASDRDGAVQGVIFLGSIRYDALKKVYDARSSLSTKMAQRMTFGLFSGASSQRIEFVRMKGPQGKGHAEMAVTKPKGSGAETPTSEPGYSATDALWDADWDDAEELFMYRHQRRLSDPSANLNNFVRGGWRTKPDSVATKARSENEGLDSMANGLNEIEAGDVRDADGRASGWGGRDESPRLRSSETSSPRRCPRPRRRTYPEPQHRQSQRQEQRRSSPTETPGTPVRRETRTDSRIFCQSERTSDDEDSTTTTTAAAATTAEAKTRIDTDNEMFPRTEPVENVYRPTIPSARLGSDGIDQQRSSTPMSNDSQTPMATTPKSQKRHNNRRRHHHHRHHQQRQQHHIEVGSEILVTEDADCPSDDNVMEKLDAGAILVNGKEELPLGYDRTIPIEDTATRKQKMGRCGEEEKKVEERMEKRGMSEGAESTDNSSRRRSRARNRGHRYNSDDEAIDFRSRRNNARIDSKHEPTNGILLRNGLNDREEGNPGDNANLAENTRLLETCRDKNANARLTRASTYDCGQRQSATLPRRRRRRAMSGSLIGNPLPPHRVTPDGTAIYYWCELPRRPGSQELDDGAYNPLWTMRGFTQTFHFWKETRRAQSVPLNAFLTYITLPWWSIAKDILDHREDPILTF